MWVPAVLPLQGPARNESFLTHDKAQLRSLWLCVLEEDSHPLPSGCSSKLHAAAVTLSSVWIRPSTLCVLKRSMDADQEKVDIPITQCMDQSSFCKISCLQQTRP